MLPKTQKRIAANDNMLRENGAFVVVESLGFFY